MDIPPILIIIAITTNQKWLNKLKNILGASAQK
jgi:hypothetical protein